MLVLIVLAFVPTNSVSLHTARKIFIYLLTYLLAGFSFRVIQIESVPCFHHSFSCITYLFISFIFARPFVRNVSSGNRYGVFIYLVSNIYLSSSTLIRYYDRLNLSVTNQTATTQFESLDAIPISFILYPHHVVFAFVIWAIFSCPFSSFSLEISSPIKQMITAVVCSSVFVVQ